jgi:hypothetical protein
MEAELPRITTLDPPPVKERLPFKVEQAIEDAVGALCDPIIVWPGYERSLPQNLCDDIILHRLIQNLKGETGVASWPEVCAYLMTTSLEHPFNRDWTEIYEYAFAQYVGPDRIPKGSLTYLKTELDRQQEIELLRFREWLWKTRRKVTHSRIKSRKKEGKTELEVEAQEAQIKFF